MDGQVSYGLYSPNVRERVFLIKSEKTPSIYYETYGDVRVWRVLTGPDAIPDTFAG